MSRRALARPWSSEEDTQLRRGVDVYGNVDMWKAIAAEFVPSRSNKACRKRWLHSLSPSLKKSGWSREEDDLLMTLFKIHGSRWAIIARHIPGRTDDACSKRYREALDPNLNWSLWTEAEDQRLYQLHADWSGKWSKVGQELGRSSLSCRNRWRLLERRRHAAKQPTNPSGPEDWDNSTIQWDPFLEHPPITGITVEQDASELEKYPFRSSTLEHALSLDHSVTLADIDTDIGQLDELDPSPHPVDPATNSQSPAENPPGSSSEDPQSLCEDALLENTDPQSESRCAQQPANTPFVTSYLDSHRLSSVRPVEDSIRPYACGYTSCWPQDKTVGMAFFATSKELSAHVKATHKQGSSLENCKPFRCALPNCGKSWKTINGLQYHLQISKGHFREAISKTLRHTPINSQAKEEPQHKRFSCPHVGCPNEYKQSSGLRYHLVHGHPPALPAQLTALPPHLAAQLQAS